MSGIASEISKYFEEVKRNYLQELIQPGEFTMSTFKNETGLGDSAAKAILDAEIKKGKITVRIGRSQRNIPCQLYKVVK